MYIPSVQYLLPKKDKIYYLSPNATHLGGRFSGASLDEVQTLTEKPALSV